MVELLDIILAKNKFLDKTRVYAGGFSMGGGMTWNLGLKHSERFAAICPTAAGTMKEGSEEYNDFVKAGTLLPVFYVAGGVSPLAETPKAKANNVNEVMTLLWKLNGMASPYTFNANSNSRFGTNADSIYLLNYRDKANYLLGQTKQELTVNEFKSADGNAYTWLCINKNKTHQLTENDAMVAWDYVKGFSRGEDGTLYKNGVKCEAIKVAQPTSLGVSYSAHVQKNGWMSAAANGAVAGTVGKALRAEAIKINLTGSVPEGATITYQTHVQKIGWQKAVSNGNIAGTTGKALRAEAVKISISNMPGYEVQYRAHVQKVGWTAWQTTANGTDISKAAVAGTTGKALRMEAIEVRVVKSK
jgi:hypothetical protein